jgi:hypothetical protein
MTTTRTRAQVRSVRRDAGRWAVAAVLPGLLLAGCTGGGGEDDPPAASTTTAGSGASVEQRSTDVVVEQTVAPPDAPEDRVTVGVESLRVEGPTMVLRLVVTPDLASVPDGEPVQLGKAMDVGAQFFGTSLLLLDRENLTEYSVVHDQATWWASASGEVESVNGEPMHAFAVFAAPPDDVEALDLRLDERWPELVDVPVTR